MSDYQQINDAIVKCHRDNIKNLTQQALDKGIAAQKILDNGFIAGMKIVGEKMKSGEMFIPEVLMAAQIMNQGMEVLKPILGNVNENKKGKVVIGTVKGDLHDIGKNLVALMCKGSGLEVIDLGVDISADQFVEAAGKNNADLVCLSALLTTTMPEMKKTIGLIEENGLDMVKVMIGGAPVTQSFAQEIGADGYASDAGSAAREANRLVSK
ncbi:MAG: corrinoid protein [Thermodesulfobacteriota bacterium]|nr:corrinoid protein [Thermodesulfobacteriota bacterium]